MGSRKGEHRAVDVYRMHPTMRAVIIFCLGGALALADPLVEGVLLHFWIAYLILFFLCFGVDAVVGGRLSRLKVSVDLPLRLYVGHGIIRDVIIEHPGGWSFEVRIRVDTSDHLHAETGEESFRIGRGFHRRPITLRADRRGVVRIEAAWLAVQGPLRLMARTRRVVLDLVIPVHPNIHAVSRNAIRHFSSASLEQGVRVERYRGDGSEFDHLQKFMPGFDIRSIDWKVSARHGKLMSRQYRAERNRQVIVAVDSGRLMSEVVEGLPRLDHAITAALSLAFVSLHVGDWVGLVSFDDRLRHWCSPVKGREGIQRLNDMAARIEYSNRETNFTLGLMELMRRQRRRALVVVMTDFVDTITAELMKENLVRVAQRHLVLFVSLRDTLVQELAHERPVDLEVLHRAMVAHHLLDERRKVIRSLRRLGIRCIDGRPDDVAMDLVNRYLDLKRKESF